MTVICKWFNHTFLHKGNLGKLNQVPIDKFTPENVLWTIKHWDFIARIDPFRLKFGDEKPLKGPSMVSVSQLLLIQIFAIHTISSESVGLLVILLRWRTKCMMG